MNIRFDNKTALVCGCTQGIGLAIATMLANAGCSIIGFARNQERLRAVIDSLPSSEGQQHRMLIADFSHPEDVRSALQNLEVSEIDIVINNSGGPPSGSIEYSSIDEFHVAFDRLLMSSHIIAQHCIPIMKQRGFGRIISIISTSVRQPLDGLGVSNTIRSATAAWSKTLSNEVAQFGITVNSVLPGATKTGRLSALIEKKALDQQQSMEAIADAMAQEVPMKRLGEPEEIASAAVFLASEQASYITGITLLVDGGRTRAL
ncbi:MAG: SDR family oxidoreductase [Ignavibacteria bacterium]|jgi:3-oxoacyl-[acyl-carrier protein] reductase